MADVKVKDPRGGVSPVTIAGVVILVVSLIGLVVGLNYYSRTNESNEAGVWDMSSLTPMPAGTEVKLIKDDPNKDGATYIQFSKPGANGKEFDLYEDFQCPACGKFQSVYSETLSDVIKSGSKLNFIPLAFLDQKQKEPTTYSTDMVGAIMALADSGDAKRTWRFYTAAWNNQPHETDQTPLVEGLENIMKDIGVKGSVRENFITIVNTGENAKVADTNYKHLDKVLGDDGVMVPSLVIDGKVVDDLNKLEDLVG